MIRAAVPLLPVELPFTADITLNVRVLAFAALVALVVSAIVGALPAIRISGAPAAAALSSATRGSTGRHDHVRRLIVAAEVAVSIVLICGSVLLFKSLLRLQSVDIGANVANVITASIDIAHDTLSDARSRDRFLHAADRAGARRFPASKRPRWPATCRSKAPAARIFVCPDATTSA